MERRLGSQIQSTTNNLSQIFQSTQQEFAQAVDARFAAVDSRLGSMEQRMADFGRLRQEMDNLRAEMGVV
eukprot:4792889-Pyramimonas_sp.AAC.1